MAPSTETGNTGLLQPVSSRPLRQESKPTTTQVPPKPQTYADAKQARQASKSVRVSGGIFRQAGNHTIVTRAPSATTRESTSRPTSSNTDTDTLPKVPLTLFQFTKSWDALQSDADKWNLICVSWSYVRTRSANIGLPHSDNLSTVHPNIVSSLLGTRAA